MKTSTVDERAVIGLDAVAPVRGGASRNCEETGADGRIDGRTARRDRNKVAVLDAVIELFEEGNLTPGVHEVADRSGISLRSVYRYFADVDDLVAAAIARHVMRAGHLFEIPDLGTGATADRIERFCNRRIELFLAIRPVFQAAVIRAADQNRLAEGITASRARLCDQTTAMFAPELEAMSPERAEVVAAMLDALTQIDAIEHIYQRRSRDADDTAEFLVAAYREILL